MDSLHDRRRAPRMGFITGGVAYHHGNLQPGEPLADFDVIPVGMLAVTDLNRYDLLVVPRSADGDALYARRYQIARYLDHGGVLVALGELWANWFPGCQWAKECAEDVLEPEIVSDHPLVDGFSSRDLHWHPSKERWCCHGHLNAPDGAEVLVRNQRGDAWLYIDRKTTNGVIVASSNLDPDTHTFHGNSTARSFFYRLLDWARGEASAAEDRRQSVRPKIAGLYSGVYFQRSFYADPEFESAFAVLPVWELEATNLHDYAALWIPRESNQDVLLKQWHKLVAYLEEGGTIVCWDEANQPWLPAGEWHFRPVNLDGIRIGGHPIVAQLTPEQVRWHSHGAYNAALEVEVLIDDGDGNVMLFLDECSFAGCLLAGTIDPDCHAGFGTTITRPLLRSVLAWLSSRTLAPAVAN